MRLLEVDSSDPRRIAGLLKVSSRAALRGFELSVIRQGRQASIPLRVVAPGTSETPNVSLNPDARPVGGSEPLAELEASSSGPRVLLQEPRVLEGFESRFRATREELRALAELGVANQAGEEDSIGCVFSTQERLRVFEVGGVAGESVRQYVSLHRRAQQGVRFTDGTGSGQHLPGGRTSRPGTARRVDQALDARR